MGEGVKRIYKSYTDGSVGFIILIIFGYKQQMNIVVADYNRLGNSKQ